MDLGSFGYNILASVIASIIFAVAAKFSLQQWKRIGIGLSGFTVIIAVATPMVFMGITITEKIQKNIKVGEAQDVLDTYLRGHFPDNLAAGYDLEVVEVGKKLILAFIYPEGGGHPDLHPWSTNNFSQKIENLMNDHGYPGQPMWGYEMKTYSSSEVLEMSEKLSAKSKQLERF